MTRQVLRRSPALMVEKRQPLLQNVVPRDGSRRKFAEVAGGTAADCAAVCCCCPCGLVNLMILAVYKVPARICRKALRRKRRKKQGLLSRNKKCGCDDQDFEIQPVTGAIAMLDAIESNKMMNNKEIVELDKEMWDKFYGAGFWRSNSQRSDVST